jgi:hypothetical protein
MKKVKRSKLNNDLKIQKTLDSELKFTDINYKSLLSAQCNDFPTRIPRPIIKKEMETNNESKTERKRKYHTSSRGTKNNGTEIRNHKETTSYGICIEVGCINYLERAIRKVQRALKIARSISRNAERNSLNII